MPCDSSHMQANSLEIEISKVMCHLNELDGLEVKPSWLDGYHPKVYCNRINRDAADKAVANLCERLRRMDKPSISKYSLELQIWWRDHEKADEVRIMKEKAQAEMDRVKESALSKLSEEEKKALGVWDNNFNKHLDNQE